MIGVGYRVLTAKNGKEAVSVFDRENRRIGIVILDMVMPEMDGETCLKAIRKINADVGVILTTGFTTDGSLIERMREQAEMVIEKPFDLNMLSVVLKDMLHERRRTKASEVAPPDAVQ